MVAGCGSGSGGGYGTLVGASYHPCESQGKAVADYLNTGNPQSMDPQWGGQRQKVLSLSGQRQALFIRQTADQFIQQCDVQHAPAAQQSQPPGLGGADPGCISAEADASGITNTLSTDDAAISQDQNNPSALQTDLQHFLSDMRALQGRFTAAEAQAQHQSVKAQIAAVISDMSAFISSLQAVSQGDTSQVSQMQTAASNLQNDGNSLNSTCSSL
jgi:hypothetical protein